MQHARAEDEAPVRFVQRLQRGAHLTSHGSEGTARRVHAGAHVDRLLPVLRQVFEEAAYRGVCEQSGGGDAALDDLGHARSLAQHLP